MAELIIWKNQEINRLRRDMDRLFTQLWDDFGVSLFHRHTRGLPFLELSETEETLILKAELPGINPDNLEITITDDILTLKGEFEQENLDDSEAFRRVHKHYGSFSRNLRLPCKISIDEVDAVFNRDVLTIILPKCKPEKARNIRIQVK